MPFTQNFNYCMEQKKYTAYKFAKIIGASNQGVLNWQDGKAIPYPKTKQKIADHFGITLAELDGDEFPVLPEKGAEKAPAPKEDERPIFDETNMRVRSAHPVSVLAAKYDVPSAVMQQILGCDIDTANNIMLGIADPTEAQLQRIAATFCVSYSDLIKGWVAVRANQNVVADIARRVSDRFPQLSTRQSSEDEP